MLNRSVLVIAPLLFAAAAMPVSAQNVAATNAANQDQATVLRANARAVVVDVVVTKGNDEPVTALHKQDFTVLEDGKPVTVDYFEEHTARTLPPGAIPPLPKMPPNVYTNVPPAPESDAVNVLLLDSLNTPQQFSTYARNEILGYLKNVNPGTRLAIVALNQKLNFVQGFTTDAALLREVVLKQTAPGISPTLVTKSEVGGEQELESFLNSDAPAAPGGATGGGSTGAANGASGAGWANPGAPMGTTAAEAVAAAFANYQSYKSVQRTRMTLEAISDIARYLAAVPGRKNLIWFAGDFPVVVFPKFDQRMDDEDNGIMLREVRKAADLLTAARVAVYPVYANGMMNDDIVSADNRSPSSASNPSRMASMAGMDNNAAGNEERAGQIAAMNQIASDTGGKAFYNTNDLSAAMTRAINDGSHYYTLVYTPTNKKMDGKYRRIDVKIPASKYKLAYRRGYNADDTLAADVKPETDPLRPLLMRGLPSATQLIYGVRVLPVSPQPPPGATRAGKNPKLTGPTTRYAIDFMVRWTDVKLDAADDGTHTGKIQIGLMAYDRDGNAVNWVGATQGMKLTPALYASMQKSGVPAHMEIDLPNTDVYLETGVYDWATGKAGTLEIPLHAAAANTQTAQK